jgi:predicted permease
LKRTFGFTDETHAPVEVVLAGMVSPGFMDALGVHGFTGAKGEIWLTHDFQQRRPHAWGSLVKLNDTPYRVAGVLPAGFRFPMEGENPDVYIVLDRAVYCCSRDARNLSGLLRLAPGASRGAAQAETHFALVDLQTALLGDRGRQLLALGLAAGLLMLVAAANASAILMARAARRLQEAAIKISLGARLRDLIREQAAQGLAVGLAAAGCGWLIAFWALHAAPRVPALNRTLREFAQIAELRVDDGVALFAAAAAMVTAVLAAMGPLTLLRTRACAPARRGDYLIVAQFAMTTVLLCLSAAVFDHLREVLDADKGFRTNQIVLAGIGIPEARYDTDAKMIEFHERVIEKLRAIPGVIDAAGGVGLPLGRLHTRFLAAGDDRPQKDAPLAVLGVASPEIFRILQIPVVAGRGFTPQDRYGHPYVAVINRRFTSRYGRGVGDRLRVAFWNGNMRPWSEFQIVGMVADAHNRTIEGDPEPAIYLSSLQVPLEGFFYFARTTRSTADLTSDFRRAVWGVDANLESIRPRPLEAYVEQGLESHRVTVWLMGAFASVAWVLAAAGMGAGVSAWVSESEREIGVRAALGESPRSLFGRVLGRGARLAAAGLTIGIPCALAGARLLRNQIPGMGSERIGPVLVTAAWIVITGIAASALPAFRAARLDPIRALRRE